MARELFHKPPTSLSPVRDPHETFTKATHLILFLRTEDWLSRIYAARVIRVISSAKSA